MRYLQRVSIKSFLIGVIGLLAFILTALSVNNVINSYRTRQEIKRIDIANELTDDILEASRFEAKERGVTSMLLSSESADISNLQMIKDLRAKGDAAFKKATELAKELIEADGTNEAFKSALRTSNELYSELEGARAKADRNFSEGGRTYPVKDWFKTITSFLEANAEMRISAFESRASKETLQEALQMNLELKQALWLASEYAGRERATVASFLGSKKPFDQAASEKLNTFRSIVDLNVKPILRLKGLHGIDPDVVKSVEEMEKVFLNKFAETRRAVISGGATGNYPVSGKEWIEKSSDGIDSILAVSAAVGKMVDDKVMADLNASRRDMIISVFSLAVILCLSTGSLLVIKNKVISPMVYLSEMMSKIEETGDLTAKIEMKSADESGKMADAFNSMIAKFNNVIREIHASSQALASASEELSASSVQIAGGSQAQSAKAAQVSTAAQQMNATLLEVAKNVSGLSTAAKEASGVAVKGGETVSDTITSMNGISETARVSSGIISTLGGRSQDIGKIISVIEDIADQTNLLALNAAIEAARAGEHGRGFAVVADEVRKLAEKTMKATKEICVMIKLMQDETTRAISSMEAEVAAVNDGVTLARQAGSALESIVAGVETVSGMARQITTATEEQSAATEQISGDIESVASVITETSSNAQQIARASQEIAELASDLKSKVEIFRVSADAGADRPVKKRPNKVVLLNRAANS